VELYRKARGRIKIQEQETSINRKGRKERNGEELGPQEMNSNKRLSERQQLLKISLRASRTVG
jgi:hypothetical protein